MAIKLIFWVYVQVCVVVGTGAIAQHLGIPKLISIPVAFAAMWGTLYYLGIGLEIGYRKWRETRRLE